MIKIFISQNIQIEGLEDEKVKRHLKKALTIANPSYYRLMNMAKYDSSKRGALYACPQEFYYFKEENGILFIPRGMKERLLSFFDKMKLEYEIKKDLISLPLERKGVFSETLRPYQEEALKVVSEDVHEGVFLMGTGTGKTILGLELIMKKGLRATILVPNTALLDQWVKELKAFYGIDAGTIYAKNKKVKDITVSTFQSLYEYTKINKELVENTGTLIIDECHGAITKQKAKVVGRFRPSNIFGITATPNREDKQGGAIGFYFGNTLFEYQPTLADPVVEVIQTGVDIAMDEYPIMIEEMVENESRNRLIEGIMTGELFGGQKKLLVLVKRIAHAEKLYEKFKDNKLVFLIHSKDKNRNELLHKFKKGMEEFRIIIGTTSLLSVGVDIPSLDTLILACDMKAETLLIQSSGRILRLFEGKEDPVIIDLWDNRNPVLNRHWYARKKVYEQKGWEVKQIGWDVNLEQKK